MQQEPSRQLATAMIAQGSGKGGTSSITRSNFRAGATSSGRTDEASSSIRLHPSSRLIRSRSPSFRRDLEASTPLV